MVGRSAGTAAALLCLGALASAWQQTPMSGSWSGVIINPGCTADEAFAEADKCFENRGPGSKVVLYDDTTRQIFDLEPQGNAASLLGDSVTVHGTLEGNTIHGAQVEKLTSIGL